MVRRVGLSWQRELRRGSGGAHSRWRTMSWLPAPSRRRRARSRMASRTRAWVRAMACALSPRRSALRAFRCSTAIERWRVSASISGPDVPEHRSSRRCGPTVAESLRCTVHDRAPYRARSASVHVSGSGTPTISAARLVPPFAIAARYSRSRPAGDIGATAVRTGSKGGDSGEIDVRHGWLCFSLGFGGGGWIPRPARASATPSSSDLHWASGVVVGRRRERTVNRPLTL